MADVAVVADVAAEKEKEKEKEKEIEFPVVEAVLLVPFRNEASQNRDLHYKTFVSEMPDRLDEVFGPGKWALLVGTQSNDGKKFSRARVLNALARIAVIKFPDAVFIFHDIDLLPDLARLRLYVASIPASKLVTALNHTGEYKDCKNYIGGICAMAADTFFRVNGFNNSFIGWGGEDDALRNAVFRLAGHVDAVHVPEPLGAVLNMEVDAAFTRVGQLRARNDDRCKMPRTERQALKTALLRQDNTDGVAELVFNVVKITDLGMGSRWDGEPCRKWYLFAYTLEVFVTLPPLWSCVFSKTKERTYFCNPAVTTGQWQVPVGTVICRAVNEDDVHCMDASMNKKRRLET
jgi:hypothetical protein